MSSFGRPTGGRKALSLRGMDPRHVLVLVDGNLLSKEAKAERDEMLTACKAELDKVSGGVATAGATVTQPPDVGLPVGTTPPADPMTGAPAGSNPPGVARVTEGSDANDAASLGDRDRLRRPWGRGGLLDGGDGVHVQRSPERRRTARSRHGSSHPKTPSR